MSIAASELPALCLTSGHRSHRRNEGAKGAAVVHGYAVLVQASVLGFACHSASARERGCAFVWRQLDGSPERTEQKKERRWRRREGMVVRAFDGKGGGGRVVFNLAVAGLLTYLTVSGKLAGLFEAVLSISLFVLVAAWFTERRIVKGPCPNCGNEFQVLESLQQEPRLCPFCSQPFRLENRQFLREAPHFSRSVDNLSHNRPNEQVVDIEAEVRDKD